MAHFIYMLQMDLIGEQNSSVLNGKANSGRRTRQTMKRTVRRTVKLKPAVLEVRSIAEKAALYTCLLVQVKARGQNCDISGYLFVKITKWRKKWLEIAEFVLYIFEKHEVRMFTSDMYIQYLLNLICTLQDVSCEKTISLPGYSVIYPVPVSFPPFALALFVFLFAGYKQQFKAMPHSSWNWLNIF